MAHFLNISGLKGPFLGDFIYFFFYFFSSFYHSHSNINFNKEIYLPLVQHCSTIWLTAGPPYLYAWESLSMHSTNYGGAQKNVVSVLTRERHFSSYWSPNNSSARWFPQHAHCTGCHKSSGDYVKQTGSTQTLCQFYIKGFHTDGF